MRNYHVCLPSIHASPNARNFIHEFRLSNEEIESVDMIVRRFKTMSIHYIQNRK